MFNLAGIVSFMLAALAVAASCCRAEEAQPIMGMGKVEARRTDRLDILYSRSVKTPHIPWMNPFTGGPLKVLAVPSVDEGRTLIELAQRLEMEYEAVTIDPAWDVNKWTIGFGKDYGARAEPNDYALLYRYLAESLTAPARYDVLLMHGIHGWARLPKRARSALLKRVREGAGLVIVGPFLGSENPEAEKELAELSPLGRAQGEKLTDGEYNAQFRGESSTGPWQAVAEHYIASAIPWSALPADYLGHYRYAPGENAQALVTAGDSSPVVAVKTCGKGRVVALGYVNDGLAPAVPWTSFGRIASDHYWEYLYGLLCRSLVWAAGKEPAVRLQAEGDVPRFAAGGAAGRALTVRVSGSVPSGARLRIDFRDESGRAQASRSLRLGKAGTVSVKYPQGLSGGIHTADCILEAGGKRLDWTGAAFEIAREGTVRAVTCDRTVYRAGDEVKAEISTASSAPLDMVAEVIDNYGRVLDRQKSAIPAGERSTRIALRLKSPLTNIAWVRAALYQENRPVHRMQERVGVTAAVREWTDYEFTMPWYGPRSYHPWLSTLDDQFRKAGVSVLTRPERNFKLIIDVGVPGFGVYWYNRQPYLEQKAAWFETKDPKYLIRDPVLSSEAFRKKAEETLRQRMPSWADYGPLAYYVADESSLTCYTDVWDLCRAPETLAAFRVWLQGEYSSLDALNREWDTAFTSWESVTPMTAEEVQKHSSYAPWADHRTFMEVAFADAFRFVVETARKIDPHALMAISGTQVPSSHNGADWSRIDQAIDYLQPYSGGNQDEMHRSFRPGMPLTGFAGYETLGNALRRQVWYRLLHGHTGASLFWHYTIIYPDLTLSPQGEVFRQVMGELQGGIGRLLIGAKRDHCGIAVHFSAPSIHGTWITDGRIPKGLSNSNSTSQNFARFEKDRDGWLQLLEDMGYQYDMLAYGELEKGGLLNKGYRVLVLPGSIALSDKEANAIRQFVQAGGTLIADAHTGLMDGHCRWAETGRLDDLLGIARQGKRLAEGKAEIQAAAGAPFKGSLGLPVAEPGLKVDGAAARGVSPEGQALFQKENGSGGAHALNFWLSG
ncbi:MAG: beta-galactosidase [Armatimonadetes bacterium]|nr:beta-galactosidase [Armatimonadota bacterium]